MLDETPRESRGIAQIAATISNGLLGIAFVAMGLISVVAIAVVAVDIADQTWASLGAQITAALGTDIAALFATFQIDIGVILANLADQNNLPEFGAWVRQMLALLMVAAVALGFAGAAPLWIARALWSRRSRGAVLRYGALLSLIGVAGLLINGAPQVIWGLVLVNGLLTTLASRTIRPSR
jgi:hypothetical protein